MFPLSRLLVSSTTTTTRSSVVVASIRQMSQAAQTSGPDRKHVMIAVGISAAAMGVVAYQRMQENANPGLRRRTTHVYPGFMPEDGGKGAGGKK